MSESTEKRTAMGSRAAYQEAVRKWGDWGVIRRDREGFRVGKLGLFGVFIEKGRGKTWRAAHDDSDRRAAKKGGRG